MMKHDPHFERADLMEQLERVAADHFDGHVSILRFTTNWRVGFGTPFDRFCIDKYAAGATFEEAARAALKVFQSEVDARFYYGAADIECALERAFARSKGNKSALAFLRKIKDQLRQYGHLTVKQYEAVRRMA